VDTEARIGGPGAGESEEEGSVWPFPSWKWLYALVIVYGVLVIGALTLVTGLLDFGAGP